MSDLYRIKRNVAKMAKAGAPEADIDGYIESEGVTLDQIRRTPLTTPRPSEDLSAATSDEDLFAQADGVPFEPLPEQPRDKSLGEQLVSGLPTLNTMRKLQQTPEEQALTTEMLTSRGEVGEGGGNVLSKRFEEAATTPAFPGAAGVATQALAGEAEALTRNPFRYLGNIAYSVGTVPTNTLDSIQNLNDAGRAYVSGDKEKAGRKLSQGLDSANKAAWGMLEGLAFWNPSAKAGKQAAMAKKVKPDATDLERVLVNTEDSMKRLANAKKSEYSKLRKAGIQYSADDVNGFLGGLDDYKSGLRESTHPQTLALIDDLQAMRKSTAPSSDILKNRTVGRPGVGFDEIDDIRKMASETVKSAPSKSPDELAALEIRNMIDNFIDETVPSNRGGSGGIAADYATAKDITRRFHALSDIDGYVRKAAINSDRGLNELQQVQTQINILRKSKRMRGFTGPEQELMKKLVRGGSGRQALEFVGHLSPDNPLKRMASMAEGGVLGNFVGLPEVGAIAAPVLGGTAKRGAQKMAIKDIERLIKLIETGNVRGIKLAQQAENRKARQELLKALEETLVVMKDTARPPAQLTVQTAKPDGEQ